METFTIWKKVKEDLNNKETASIIEQPSNIKGISKIYYEEDELTNFARQYKQNSDGEEE